MLTDFLCRCNRCEATLIDENPQTDAIKHDLFGIEQNMTFIQDKDGGFWACPNCLTDDDLDDI